MNLYEALGAPPTLSSKDMSMHIKMMPSAALSKEQRTQFNGELLNPKTRLYNELKTLRFPPRPGAEEINSLYKNVCEKITHASGEPIPYRFFKTEFQRLLVDCSYTQHSSPAELTENTLTNAINRISDIWRFQGYAALFLRIAENSELSDPKNAHRAWLAALKAYQRFFAEADVKDSCTYLAQTEEKFRQDCSEAWNGFLAEQLEDVYQRMKRYIQQNNTDSVGACLQILQLSPVKSIAPGLQERASQDSLLPYASSMRTAPSLSIAGEMYNNCPQKLLAQDERGECKRALLGALKKAVDQLGTGGANIDEIVQWAKTLKAAALYQEGALLVKKDAGDFFEACAKFIRAVIQDDKFDQTKEMELLVTILPADFVVARSNDRELKQDDMLGYGVLNYINDTVKKEVNSSISPATAGRLGKQIYTFINQNIPQGKFRDKTLGEVNRHLIVQLQQKQIGGPAFQAFIDEFPGDWPVSDPQFKNMTELRDGLFGSPLARQALTLLQEASSASAGTYDQERKLRALIDFACNNTNLDLGKADADFRALVDHVLLQAFIGNFNIYTENQSNGQAKDTIRLCGSFLPDSTEVPSGAGNKLTVEMLMLVMSISKDTTLSSRRQSYDIDWLLGGKKTTPTSKAQPKPTPKPTPKPKTKSKPKHTKINGIRFRGGSVAAAVQYFLWMLLLPVFAIGCIASIPIRSYALLVMQVLMSRAMYYVWAALLFNGIFGLMANSSKGRVSGFGKAMRAFVWMVTALLILAYASFTMWPQSVAVRILLAAWGFILLFVMNKQIDKNAFYSYHTVTIDTITYHGGGIAVFFKFIIMQLIIPAIVASVIYVFDLQPSPGWIFVFKLYGIALALGVLRAFFTCLAEKRGVKRFATFMATEIYMLILPICGWYSIDYFNAYPLKWWVIVLYSVYGLIFLIGTIAAAQSDD